MAEISEISIQDRHKRTRQKAVRFQYKTDKKARRMQSEPEKRQKSVRFQYKTDTRGRGRSDEY